MVNGAGLEPATTGLKVRTPEVTTTCNNNTCTGTPETGAPNVAPELEKAPMPDPRQALLDALRGVDRETLLAVLADLLDSGTNA